jgi:hypothetical protein
MGTVWWDIDILMKVFAKRYRNWGLLVAFDRSVLQPNIHSAQHN